MPHRLGNFQNGKCIGVKGIDNDQALGLNTQHPHQTLFVNDEDIEAIPQSKHGYISDKDLSERRAHHGYRGVWLPPVMDTEMVAAFKTMTENDIKEAMQGLSDAEITATIKRLEAIKDHIVVLEKRTAALAKEKKPGPIIAPEQWGSTEVTEWMFPSTNATAKFMEMSTNYLDREIKDSMRLKNKI